jgi:hypothetical protein
VFRTAAIMLDVASPASLDLYRDHIHRYSNRFSEECWGLVYQADTRARRELAERIRRRGLKISESSSVNSGNPAGSSCIDSEGVQFDIARPWDYVFRRLPLEFSFWKEEIEDAALLIMSRAVKQDSAVTGEAPIANRNIMSHLATFAHADSGAGAAAGSSGAGGGPGKGRSRSRFRAPPGARQYNVDPAGRNVTNRQGRKLCPEFQTGACVGRVCPVDSERAHQCAVCLDTSHGAHSCTQTSFRAKGSGKSKGRGKGRGKYHG